MKTKTLTLLLTLVLTLSMVLMGCGSGNGPVSGTLTPSESEPVSSGSSEEENSLALGRMEGGVYTNTYAGFACELDSTWTFYSAAELQELPDAVLNAMDGTELGDAMQNIQQITDMMAENTNTLTTMNVLYQKLSLQERIAYAAMTDEAIVDATLAQKDMLTQAYTQAGIEVDRMEKITVTFLGEEHVAIKTTAQTQGVPYYILQVFDFHVGEYGVTLTLGSFVEDNTGSLLELFYKVD